MFTKYSVIRKFGIPALACSVAARATVVLLKLCGDTATKYGSAIAAISRSSRIPPTLPTSGLIMSAACFSNTALNSCFVYSSSPVTTGIRTSRRTDASASRFSASTGSSYQKGRYCSISRATLTACIGASRLCMSSSMSTSGPTASRTV